MKETVLFEAISGLLEGVPASVTLPVLCEALIHAINCTENELRLEAREAALSFISENVDLNKPAKMVMMS